MAPRRAIGLTALCVAIFAVDLVDGFLYWDQKANDFPRIGRRSSTYSVGDTDDVNAASHYHLYNPNPKLVTALAKRFRGSGGIARAPLGLKDWKAMMLSRSRSRTFIRKRKSVDPDNAPTTPDETLDKTSATSTAATRTAALSHHAVKEGHEAANTFLNPFSRLPQSITRKQALRMFRSRSGNPGKNSGEERNHKPESRVWGGESRWHSDVAGARHRQDLLQKTRRLQADGLLL